MATTYLTVTRWSIRIYKILFLKHCQAFPLLKGQFLLIVCRKCLNYMLIYKTEFSSKTTKYNLVHCKKIDAMILMLITKLFFYSQATYLSYRKIQLLHSR